MEVREVIEAAESERELEGVRRENEGDRHSYAQR